MNKYLHRCLNIRILRLDDITLHRKIKTVIEELTCSLRSELKPEWVNKCSC